MPSLVKRSKLKSRYKVVTKDRWHRTEKEESLHLFIGKDQGFPFYYFSVICDSIDGITGYGCDTELSLHNCHLSCNEILWEVGLLRAFRELP